MDMVFTALGSTALAGVVSVVITAISTRRKMGADATKIITEAAGGMVSRLEEDNKRLREDNTSFRTKVDAFEQSDRRRGRRDDLIRLGLEAQTKYSMVLAGLLRDAGIAVPDPPTLLFDLEADTI